MEPFDDEFEFKPLTEGLGFHKKAEKLKSEVKSSRIEQDVLTSRMTMKSNSSSASLALTSETENDLLGRDIARPASQSISDLIASLPPALDFVQEDSVEGSASNANVGEVRTADQSLKGAANRPQIFQPLARPDYKSQPVPAKARQAPRSQTATPQIRPAAVEPVPRHNSAKQSSVQNRQAAVSPANSAYRERLEESFARAFPSVESRSLQRPEHRSDKRLDRQTEKRAEKRPVRPLVQLSGELTPVTCHFGAGLLDAMVVAGVSSIMLVCILAITHVNLTGLLGNAETDVPTRIHLILLGVAVLQLYMLTAHSFFGSTLGEWAFEIQLGTDDDQKATFYPLLAAWRTMLMTITGFFIVPAVSLAMGRDLASYVSGLKLYRRS